MALYERLLGYTDAGASVENRLPQHGFIAMMAERARGRVTNAQVIAAFALTTEDQTELVTLVTRFTTGGSRLTREEFEDAVYLAASRIPPYDSPAALRARLGV